MSDRARTRWILVLIGAAGMAGQTLLMLEAQCWSLERSLREDFRVVLFLRGEVEERKRKVMEEKLRAFPDAETVRFVSADDALAEIKRDDPELAESVSLVGGNPLPSAFEVRPSASAYPRLAEWIESLRESGEWSDLRYKSGQAQAVLRLRFYAHALRVVLSSLFCLAAAMALASVAAGPARLRASFVPWSLVGAAAGAGTAAAAFWPLRRDEAIWAWPSWTAESALLAACVALGAGLMRWRDDS